MKIGILGGGQLALMLCMAARRLGIETVVVSETTDAPAKKLTDKFIHFDPNSFINLDRVLKKCEVVTVETEAIEPELIRHLNKNTATNFGLEVFGLLANKYNQKNLAKKLHIPTLEFDGEINPEQYIEFKSQKNSVLKQKTSGYDGYGVVFPDQIKTFEPKNIQNYYIEKYLPTITQENNNSECIAYELAIIGVKSKFGKINVYAPTKTYQQNGICIKTLTSTITTNVERKHFKEAIRYTEKLMSKVEYIGSFAIEYFVTNRNRVLFNELAPRVHNSGHWTIDGATIDQFENHLRAICGYPVGNTESITEAALTMNIIGGVHEQNYLDLMSITDAKTYHYGKSYRAGRKLGHITAVGTIENIQKIEKQITSTLYSLPQK